MRTWLKLACDACGAHPASWGAQCVGGCLVCEQNATAWAVQNRTAGVVGSASNCQTGPHRGRFRPSQARPALHPFIHQGLDPCPLWLSPLPGPHPMEPSVAMPLEPVTPHMPGLSHKLCGHVAAKHYPAQNRSAHLIKRALAGDDMVCGGHDDACCCKPRPGQVRKGGSHVASLCCKLQLQRRRSWHCHWQWQAAMTACMRAVCKTA